MSRVHSIAICGASALLVAGCAAGPVADSTASTAASAPSDGITPANSRLDCTATRTAMSDYATAVMDLAVSVQADDGMSAVAASDAILYAIDQLLPTLQSAPESTAAFGATGWAVASMVKTAVSKGTSVRDLAPQITEAYSDPDFMSASDAIEEYVDAQCPSPVPSPT